MIDLFNTNIDFKTIIGKRKISFLKPIGNEVFAFFNKKDTGIQISENGKVDMKWFNKSQKEYQKESEEQTAEMGKTWKDREMTCWYFEHKGETT